MAGIVLEGVSRRFGPVAAVDGVDLSIGEGEFFALVGPSGCGKTTLLRLVAGLEMAFQSYALYPHMTVYNNIAFGLRRQRSRNLSPLAWLSPTSKKQKSEIDQRVQQVAESLQISHLLSRKPKELSGGQKQRVALGRAIARNPQVFLMDEPLSNLDAQLRSDTRSQIVQLQKQLQVTTIYVTHDQVEAMTMGDRIVVLNKGDIQQVDTPLNIYRQPANVFVAGFMGSPPMNFLSVQVDSNGNLHGESLHQPISINGLAINQIGRDRAFTLGFRPEDLQPTNAENAHLEGTVELVEALGSETIVLLKIANTEIRARISADTSLEYHWQIGDRSFWRFELHKLYAFDADSGVTLHHPYQKF